MKSKTQLKMKGNKSTIYSALIGAAVALLLSLLLSAGATSLAIRGSIAESGYNFSVFMIRAISVFLGALVGTWLSKEKYLLIIGIIAAVYTVVLISLGIVIYDDSFQNFGMGLLSVLLGGAAGFALKIKGVTGHKRGKIRKM